MTGQITPAMRAAFPVVRAAMKRASALGAVDAIVVDLDAADLLQTTDASGDLERLRQERAALNGVLAGADEERALLRARLAELEPYEALRPQECAAGQHRPWFADAPAGTLACPWCRVAELEDAAGTAYRASHDSIVIGHYTTEDAAREHCEAYVKSEHPGAVLDWLADEEDFFSPAELVAQIGDEEHVTGYVVTPMEINSVYDPEAEG